MNDTAQDSILLRSLYLLRKGWVTHGTDRQEDRYEDKRADMKAKRTQKKKGFFFEDARKSKIKIWGGKEGIERLTENESSFPPPTKSGRGDSMGKKIAMETSELGFRTDALVYTC